MNPIKINFLPPSFTHKPTQPKYLEPDLEMAMPLIDASRFKSSPKPTITMLADGTKSLFLQASNMEESALRKMFSDGMSIITLNISPPKDGYKNLLEDRLYSNLEHLKINSVLLLYLPKLHLFENLDTLIIGSKEEQNWEKESPELSLIEWENFKRLRVAELYSGPIQSLSKLTKLAQSTFFEKLALTVFSKNKEAFDELAKIASKISDLQIVYNGFSVKCEIPATFCITGEFDEIVSSDQWPNVTKVICKEAYPLIPIFQQFIGCEELIACSNKQFTNATFEGFPYLKNLTILKLEEHLDFSPSVLAINCKDLKNIHLGECNPKVLEQFQAAINPDETKGRSRANTLANKDEVEGKKSTTNKGWFGSLRFTRK